MATTTPNLGLTKPDPSDPDDDDVWGPMLNGNADILDGAVQAALDDAAQAIADAAAKVSLTGNETVAGNKTFSNNVAVNGDFGISTSPGAPTSGYIKLPKGMILQWGLTAAVGAGAQSITFPIAFPTALRGLSAQLSDAVATAGIMITMWITARSTTGFSVMRRFSGGAAADAGGDTLWIAVGN